MPGIRKEGPSPGRPLRPQLCLVSEPMIWRQHAVPGKTRQAGGQALQLCGDGEVTEVTWGEDKWPPGKAHI